MSVCALPLLLPASAATAVGGGVVVVAVAMRFSCFFSSSPSLLLRHSVRRFETDARTHAREREAERQSHEAHVEACAGVSPSQLIGCHRTVLLPQRFPTPLTRPCVCERAREQCVCHNPSSPSPIIRPFLNPLRFSLSPSLRFSTPICGTATHLCHCRRSPPLSFRIAETVVLSLLPLQVSLCVYGYVAFSLLPPPFPR